MKHELEKAGISSLDVRIAVSILICCLTSTVLNAVGLKFTYGEMHLEIMQKMTACIACLLCCQDTTKASGGAGKNRLIITAIGGIVGIIVIFLDNWIDNVWIMAGMVTVGILVTLFLCKAAKVPYINARIGGVTFILVTSTLSGPARIWYGVFRFVSTIYGVLIVLLVTWTFSKFAGRGTTKRGGNNNKEGLTLN